MMLAMAENAIPEEGTTLAGLAASEGGESPAPGFLQSLPEWALPALIGVLLLLAILLVWALIRKKQKKTAPAAAAPTESSVRTESSIFSAEGLPVKAIGNVHGVGARADQQDAFGVSDLKDLNQIRQKGILAIVADGMGGLNHSGDISHALVQQMLKEYSGAEGTQRERLLTLGALANNLASERFGRDTGTTLIAASIQGDQLDFLSIGDSRIALCRSGALLTLNRMHNYAADLDSSAARGLVSISSAMNDPKRARLTSYVGMNDPKAVDLPASPMALQKGDRVLLMTDGLYGTLSDPEILSVMDLPAPEAAQKLDEMVQAAGNPHQDNYTAIILEI